MDTAIEIQKGEPESTRPGNHCCHYWVIQSEDGPTSRGKCKYCHQEREFRNYLGDHPVDEGRIVQIAPKTIPAVARYR